ncbi:MAG TPA: peptide ABC transporter substrate-binding protein [Candidatus Baltobacteraceae bacterium]|nr:peptide ABC transporter substrate-binding protein [Candidatus Baltobacteraceae bacterium]
MKRFVALALAAVVAGCTQTGGTGNAPSGTQPGTLRVAVQSDFKNMNPLLTSNTTDALLARFMFEPLLTSDPKGNPLPMLATQVPTPENGGIGKDGLTITYHLRRDAKWTDGQSVTAADVKFSWQAIMNGTNNVITRHGYDYVSRIDTPNPYTVVVHLKRKFAPFVNTFFADSDAPFPIVPQHVLAKYSNINQIPFNNDPSVSDGPFKFVRWVHGDHVELAANPGFFMGAPKLNSVVLRIIPDENTTVNLLRTHEIDWMFESSIDNYPQIKNIRGVNIVWDDINGYEYMQMNLARPYLQDLRVRQAIAYAIDKQRVVQTSTFGQEKIATADQPPFLWSYDPNLPQPVQNVQKARQLLQEAGWAPGPDGIMTKNGERLLLVMVSNNSNVTRRKNSVLIQEMLRQAGIQAQIKYYTGDVLFAPAGEGGILQSGSFDLGLVGWSAGIDPDDSTQLTCANLAPNGYNFMHYCNPDMEAAQRDALLNYEQATRKKAYARIQELQARDLPWIILWYQRFAQPVSTAFKGFAPNPAIENWNAWQWSI